MDTIYACGVPGRIHDGDLHEWELGKPGMGTIILCAIHERGYITTKTKMRPADCGCRCCKERAALSGGGDVLRPRVEGK